MATGDKLEFWHPMNETALLPADLEWGDIPAGSSADKTLRVFNASYSYSAVNVTISIEEIGVFTPVLSVAAQHYLSLDRRVFTATVVLGTLTPRALSPLITLRRVTAADADTGKGEFQLRAHAEEWN